MTSAPADPVERHVAALGAALRGPGALRHDVLAEVRDGLHDAAAAHRDSGSSAPEAAARAVAEFGPVDELAPLYQEELTAAQARRTALVVAVLFPALLLGWDLLWTTGHAWPAAGPVSPLVPVLARAQDVLSVVATALALVVLLATLHRRVRPRLLAASAAVVGLAGAVLCLGIAVVMNVANGPAALTMIATEPTTLPAFAVSLAAGAVVTTSALRTLRLIRTP